ncbi:branched-chain alpha-keto acid dehydrogenase subunit E2 [Rathayibacter sp. AY2B7]|uniref:dihydrolipoamide acetyltransferase family protein n=1 Tax=Rathayibacter sp. AY2B7 TaxID=2080571 RepID=UPI000CE75A8A|nr:dihydrolipoamide acetyltransferase family protein [Rathayibacter sp. AY2B7]PPG62636.1 branched-chain alpha-keto acid dehydrogenase subunit E2 [Rathayibacter sp. AY2B7]
MTEQFLLPDVGEGLTEAEIVAWKVKVGDEVAVNQVLVEIETAKSLVELPSPFSGTVVDVLVDEGQTVDVGTAIITVQAGAGSIGSEVPAIPAHPAQAAAALPVIAKPPIRKLAKDLDVDLLEVQATGLAGEVTRDDVIRHASQASVFRNIQTPAWGDDREERIPVRGVRKAIAAAMSTSAFTAPHVSVFVDVDATRTMEFVKRLKNSPDFAGVKVSPLLIMAKAIIWAVRRNPTVNSAWTDTEIVVRHYVNLGIAAATPRGLLVPNVKDAQSMSLLELAQALEKLTLDARDGKTTAADMQNGTITITNIGVFGMDTGTPILNPGEVAIIALGTIKQKPWVVDGEVRPRFVTTVGGSFDHRVVDGDVVSRFVADVASVLEEPALLLD